MNRFSSTRGTVTLVALCFVTVMGITLAGYIAVCSRAMNMSNRTFHGNLSKQLAEVGIDEALRAYNRNDWDNWASNPTNVVSGAWTLDTTNKRATRTITFNSPKFGQGVTGTVKIRIDNYDANQLNSTWNSSSSYRVGDKVGYNGIWYSCVRNHSNQAPIGNISNYWAPEGVSWTWVSTTGYAPEQIVNYSGYWYRCISSNTNSPPTGTATSNANWIYIPAVNKDSTSGIFGVQDAVVNWFGTWYRYNTSTGWDNLPLISLRWRSSGMVYRYNDTVCYNNVWYRYISGTPTNTTSTYGAPNTDNTRWSTMASMWLWNSSINYNPGDAIYYSSTAQWYRCIRAPTSSGSITPSDTEYWTNAPLYSSAWDANKQYGLNHTVRYNGVWYKSIHNGTSNVAQNPATATGYWIGANTADTSYQWNATTAYTTSDYKCFGGVWYKCSAANTGQTPNNTSYWTATWVNSHGVTTGAPVVYAEGTITISGSPPLRTQLRATVAPAPLFPNAIAATTTLAATSGGTVDSYDSSIGAYGGSNIGYSAVVAGGNTGSTAVTLSGAVTVSGHVAAPSSTTSPFAPLFSYGTSTVVKGTLTTPSPKVDTSRVSRSPFIPKFDPLPSGGLTAAFGAAIFPKGTQLVEPSGTGNTVSLGTPGATTPSRYYFDGNLTISHLSSIRNLSINGPVILYINGDLILDGNNSASDGIINITSTGSAEIHVADSLNVLQNSSGINNMTLDPKKLILICDTTSSSTQKYADGGNEFYGIIYIPYTTNSSGFLSDNTNSPGVEIFGAVSANKVIYSGANLNIHYDTSLRHATFGGVDQPWTVAEWRELPVTEQATMP